MAPWIIRRTATTEDANHRDGVVIAIVQPSDDAIFSNKEEERAWRAALTDAYRATVKSDARAKDFEEPFVRWLEGQDGVEVTWCPLGPVP